MTTAPAPALETPRLRLRAHRLDDFDALAARWGHPEVARHIGGVPSTREESWARLLKFPGHWALLGYGYWAVDEKGAAGGIGDVGFADHKREMTPSIEGVPELGWALSPSAFGKGYATEAALAALAWADERGWPRTVCIIKPENAASIRVADKCGFRLVAETQYKGKPTLLFERRRP